jgi:2-oxoglutarate dehydrogenase E1 component
MADKTDPALGINRWLEDELYQEYLHDHAAVDDTWKKVFAPAAAAPTATAATGDMQPIRGAAARIVANMEASLAVPVATSQRTIPVKVVDENRTIINQHLALVGKSKVSYTHLIGWAVVKALQAYPNLNNAYVERDGQPFRHVRAAIHFGVAIDVAAKDGAHSLVVPNIKNAGALGFSQFVTAFDDLVARARTGKLTLEDFQGSTVSLTNPGTVGTVGSIPRLMAGQGAIIATGAIDYPAEYHGAAPDTRALLGISKVMTMTCTYDHRIIQGAESGLFLARVQALLQGEERFYDDLFADLHLPYQPVRWEPDRKAFWPGGGERTSEIAKQAAVLQLINAYRVRGHLIADLDPLGAEPSYHAELDPANYGLTIWDLDREFITGSLAEAMRGGGAPQAVATLRQILQTLRQTYCGKLGCEYMNIQVPEQKRWLQQRMEPAANAWPLDAATRRRILERLVTAEEFEHFLHTRFVGHKRFSLEGAESAMAIIDELMHRASAQDVHEFVIGMAHRGRLNVLANVIGKPLEQIFSSFEMEEPMSAQGSGDVKYHLGASGVRTFADGREMVVSVSPNPSHLEAVDPVVEGIVRPKQDRLGDTARKRVIPLLIHGDAAFAGQGVVAETLNLSQLDGYSTGGTVHLIINNQIGFTTLPEEARSTPYSTDVARMVQAPIFHVNGDDPEAAIRAAQLAFDYRQQFGKDVVIDMFCYRRHGHNEADDPSYTQPILYKKIREHPSVAVLYAERLLREGAMSEAELDGVRRSVKARLSAGFDAAEKRSEEFPVQELTPVAVEDSAPPRPQTAVDRATLARVVEALTRFPEDFHLHPKLRGFIERRREMFDKGGPVDWAFAEALAYGSLVLEGTPVRLSGQDSSRGTFTQRHAVFFDYEDGHEYCPLRHVAPDQARFDVYDSLLSEEAVVGFEFGYSLGDPLTLVLWEAQFGDFVNGAQVMIDQFIAGSLVKWGQPSGLVLLLPHGYEGQGPEHSSARIERFLQLAAEGNLQVVYPSTPAQYFHLLRRQMHGGEDRRGVRRPLVVFTPKSLLRHAQAVSPVEDLAGGGFREVIAGGTADPGCVTRVLLCAGKIYYDLAAAREQKHADHIALVRIEQLYPFAYGDVEDVLARYPADAEVFWVQEEPRNMGAWRYIHEQVQPLIAQTRRVIGYVGRNEGAATATGSHGRHQEEQKEIVEAAFAPSGARAGNIRVIGKRRA